MRLIFALLLFLLSPLAASAAVTVSNGVSVNGNTCDQLGWLDSAGRTRTASIVQLNGAPGAKVGGFITQVVYNPGAGNVTCNESGFGVDGNLSGLGHMVNHGGTGNGWVSSNVDGIKAGGSTQVIFQGANHVIYQADMDMYGDNGDYSKGTWHSRWQYMVSSGHDYITQSISYDFSSRPAGYWGYTGIYSQQGHDSRSPYCSFNWTGTGAANTMTESIDGIEFAQRDAGTNSYIFRTNGSSPFAGGYTYNTPGSNIPYTLQWKNSPDREIGYISTFDLTEFAAGGGFTAETKIGLTSATMPQNWGISYQSNGFQGWMGDKMTWGVPYGAAGGDNGVSTFNDWTYARTWSGYPTMGYTLRILLGAYSANGVRQQVADQAAIKALPSNALTAAVGTVLTTGKMNLQSPTSAFTLKPQGYNHLYHAWEVVCAADQADINFALGATVLRKPIVIFDNYTQSTACPITLNGVTQVEGTNIFTSVDTVNDKLYVTFNANLTGAQHIVLGSCAAPTATPTLTPTLTPCGACTNTPTLTPTDTPTTGSKDYCVHIDYSAVPALVNDRKITVKVNVGTCSSVSVLVDGSPVPATYSGGIATFSTTGGDAVITANGWTSGGTGAATKALLYNDHRWAHSLTFDDGIRDQFNNAKPLLDARGLRAGMALNASGIVGGNSWNVTWANAQALRAAGWDIFNHSYTHPAITCANFATEFGQNQTLYQTYFPGYNVSHIVYPFEDTSAASCGAWPPNYIMSGEGGGGLNYVDAAFPNIYRLYRNSLYGASSTAWQATAASAAGNARPTWLITITHSVASGSTAPGDAYSTNANTLATYLDYLQANYGPSGNGSMWFAPSGEVYDYILTRDNAVLTTPSCGTPTPTPTVCGSCTDTPTLTATNTPTITPTATNTPLCSPSVLDNMEDGDNQNSLGGFWYVYAGTGTSTANPVAFAMTAPGYGPSLFGARAYGNCDMTGQPSLGTSFAATDFSAYGGFNFWFKGDGKPYRFQIHSAVQGGAYNDYKYDFTPPVGWSQINVPWASFSFPGWGTLYALDKTQITGLSWVPTTAGAYDMSVDDLMLPCAAAPTMTSTHTVTRTFSPTRTATATRTSTMSATPSFSASSTPSSSSTSTATPSFSASPTISATETDVPPGSSHTSTRTVSPSSTASSTATPSSSATMTPSASASPTHSQTETQVPAGSSHTSTRTATGTTTATPSATASQTLVSTVAASSHTSTRTSTPTMTFTETPGSGSSSPPPSATAGNGQLEVIALQAVPNPNPGSISVRLGGAADQVTLKIYTSAETCVASVQSGPLPAGWSAVPLAVDWLKQAPNGLYFVRAVASQGSRRSLPGPAAKLLLAR